MRDGSVLDRSGKPDKPSTIRGYERVLRLRVLPGLGHVRLSSLERRDNPLPVIGRSAIRDGDVAIDPTDGLELPAVRGRRERVPAATRPLP